ncbi:hypothetical protein TNCV_2397601 [Trichonephila clavipes]|uniref:Uncharacterized protein n=1 Tax=Trichonephila clavipes TaxID=2585209 RepID=A0A8X6VR76_TRICX|nr:hypothetical protein TNCV_2397601 [Trichonephila clavipes]
MNKTREPPTGLYCPITLSREFMAVDADFVSTALIMADKCILEFVQSSKNIIDADDEKEMTYTAPVPTSSKMKNVMKSMHSYLNAHSNGEMNNKVDNKNNLLKIRC